LIPRIPHKSWMLCCMQYSATLPAASSPSSSTSTRFVMQRMPTMIYQGCNSSCYGLAPSKRRRRGDESPTLPCSCSLGSSERPMYRGFFVMDTAIIGIPRTRTKRRATTSNNYNLQDDMDNLEAKLDGMREFILILMHCPRIVRQPYSAYMFMERCMFGRHAEKERIVNFLLHPCSSSSLDVLPVVGVHNVGKRTLVEHACREEKVQGTFRTSCVSAAMTSMI
jgi:hypothetical protein